MPRETLPAPSSLNRRAALGSVGVAAAALGLGPVSRVAAQEATPDAAMMAMATHPAVGTWNAMTPGGPVIGVFLPDGTNLVVVPATQAGPNGVEFISTQAGRWEPVSERGIHFTSVQWHSDAQGIYTGSVTVDSYPVISEDGQTLLDDQSRAVITIRDATGAVVQEISGAGEPPVTGVRMDVGAPGFPGGMSGTATPTT
jgi:hypothetical protein